MVAPRELDSDSNTRPPGFTGSLEGASLADLVQMECLSGARCVMRVTSGDDIGYLYFDRGRVVHAMSSSNFGEAAALEMLAWTSGNFQPCNAGWPDSESIHSSVQSLVLRAAQARDESGHHNLVQFRRPRTEPMPRPRDERLPMNKRSEPPTDLELRAPESRRPPPSIPASGVTKVQAAVRLDASGSILSSKGSGTEELAAAAALATRLAGLIGDAFGLEKVVAIESSGLTQRTLIVVEKNGNLVGLRAPSDTDLASVRERYGI